MRTLYKPTFLKDLKCLQGTPFYDKIKSLVFEEIPVIRSFGEISNLSKIKDSENAYRIRVGDYRIGITIDGDTFIFVRCLHRKEIYRYFP